MSPLHRSLLLSLWTLVGLSSAALAVTPDGDSQYKSAKEAFSVGAVFYNSRNYKSSRAPFEAALRMAEDDKMRVKIYKALIPAYRELPEFEPYQTAAEFIIRNTTSDAERSLMRRSYLSFAYKRGQLDALVKRYEAQLRRKKDDYMAVYLLAEIYSKGKENPDRAIELLKQLEKLQPVVEKVTATATSKPAQTSAADVKLSRQKAKLARQYIMSRREGDLEKGARLYEEIAPLNPETQGWYLKESAAAWLRLGNQKEALRVALHAEEVPAEARNDLMIHFYHRSLGDTFLKLDKPEKAIPHYEIAIEKTDIDGYIKGTQKTLDEARAQVR